MTAEKLKMSRFEEELFSSANPPFLQFDHISEDKLATRSNFILKRPGAMDFGGKGQSSLVLLSGPDSLINEGVWVAMGTIEESGGPLSILVKVNGVAGIDLSAETLYQINQNLRKLMQMKGVMVKGSGKEIWIRTAPETKDYPILFETIGALLAKRLKREFPEINTVLVVFAVGKSRLATLIGNIATQTFAQSEKLKESVWKERGFDFRECHVLGHCGKCSEGTYAPISAKSID